nr:unnamed protein product [Digitaria exilis]
MAGLIASGIIKWTASKLSSLVSAPIGSSSSSDEEQTSAVRDVQMLQRTMASVQRTLEAADEDSIREVSGRLRLRELQQFAYDAQDAIDEYKFELLRRRMDDPDGHREDRSTRKRKRKGDKKEPETDPVVVPVPDELANRVKRILERFKEMTKAWDDLKLDEADAPLREEEEDFVPGPTTPHVDEPTIIGRGLGRVTNIDDAQTANLISKKYLQILRLDWSAGFCDIECEHIANQNNPTSTPELDEDVFDSLKPHRNIEELESQEPDGASYDQEVLETLRDDSEDDFKVLSEDEDDDDFYDRMFEVGQSSGMAIDYNDDSDDAC